MGYVLARYCLLCTVAAVLVGVAARETPAQGQQETATYYNKRFGFTLSYPTAQFKPKEPLSDDGRVWISHDGNASLLAGALPNADSMNLRDYREFLLKETYAGAEIQYSPIQDTWFVLSGTRGETVFYERVTFTCGGRLINSWAILYPVGERQLYNRIVEQVARSYRPGQSNCG